VFLTRPPLAPLPLARHESSFDLHVLGTPPAFILSQDQTRHPSYGGQHSLTGMLLRVLGTTRALPHSYECQSHGVGVAIQAKLAYLLLV
jgi:hypothetical protein